MLKVICSEYPAYNWNGFERVYAIVGLVHNGYLVINRFSEIPNGSDTPEETFTVIAKDLIIITTGIYSPESIVGFAHTHPPAQYIPSDEDIAGMGKGLFGLVLCENNRVWYSNSGELLISELV